MMKLVTKDTKRCTTCGQIKNKSEFHISKDKPRSNCKECYRETRKEADRRYRETHREMRRDQNRRWIYRKYGIEQEHYDQMFKEQDGKCAICGCRPRIDKHTGMPECLCIDHDHKTGLVRRLLCHDCNVAIGLLKEDPQICRIVANYLDYYQKPLRLVKAR
jgi:hypothetical protein